MSPIYPRFFKEPGRYVRWAAIEKPAIFWSIILGCMGPAMFVVAPPIRRIFGDDKPIAKIPLTYPIPSGPRKELSGYDDE
ncbi:hypothetical protein BJ878DRAFT_430682 [Calycina marina]|uniref:NADH-ubiquinone oxidoreductase 9.5 kDa subunit n=1 Tax=Calycina marina TaxID=1763456 RepID=A0A9P7YW07_9HELO|nr:hypothetical protein BJ878DRAFT_430682 [Calycina marina]